MKTKLLEQLGYLWMESWRDENLAMASLLTGRSALLMVGAHGAAKTHAAGKIAQAHGLEVYGL